MQDVASNTAFLTEINRRRRWRRHLSGLAVAAQLAAAVGWQPHKIVCWEPRDDGSVNQVVWFTNDERERVPDWVLRLPFFVATTQFIVTASTNPWTAPADVSLTGIEGIGCGGTGMRGQLSAGGDYAGGGGGGGAYAPGPAVQFGIGIGVGR